MSKCEVAYIPKHLHQDKRKPIPEFFDLERLYWRLGSHPKSAPYSGISLMDISFNRSGIEPNIFSYQEDVLWNIEPDTSEQKYVSEIVVMLVKRIFQTNPPCKVLVHPDDETAPKQRNVAMSLVHDPIPCNYSHSMIVFDIENSRVTSSNYSEIFGSKPYKKLRKACRDELHKAILKGELEI